MAVSGLVKGLAGLARISGLLVDGLIMLVRHFLLILPHISH